MAGYQSPVDNFNVDSLSVDSLDVLQSYALELERQVHLRTHQLEKQIKQEHTLAEILQRIRQSLDPSAILQSAVTEVRGLLKADRVLIYQFEPDWSGKVVTESVGDGWPISLGCQIEDTCFQTGGGERYHQGRKVAIANINDANLSDCHLQMLAPFKVRATLVVPILWANHLWGLLVAHQCSGPRIWQADELELLDRLSVQLAIAIRQAELYQQAQAEICDRNLAQAALQKSEHQLRQAVETFQHQNQLLASISRIQNHAIVQSEPQVLFDDLLDSLLTLTQSEYGVIGEVLYTSEGAPYMEEAYTKVSDQLGVKTQSIAPIDWDAQSQALYAQKADQERTVHTLKTLLGAILATGQPVMTMAPKTSHQRGSPEDEQPPLQTCLGVPFFSEDRLIGMVGIANKSEGYDLNLVDYLQPFLATCGQLVESYCNLKQRRRTDQKIAEQAALLNVTTDAILVRDLGNQIVFWNRGAEALYGWTETEALGQNANTLLYGDGELPGDIQSILLTQGHWQGELTQVNHDGQNIVVESRWALVRTPDGQPTSILTVNTDITEQKQLEDQFLRAQRLESIGTLASGIAHDLNNILTPIVGIAQLLPMKLSDTDEYTQRLLDILQDNAKRGVEIVKQVLTFARGEEGQRTEVAIEEIIQEIYPLIESTFPKRIAIILDIATELDRVEGDKTQLHQVLMNLCVNARDAMPEGGTLTLKVENFQVNQAFARVNLGAHVGNYVVVSIQDTGVGMPPAVKERIFEPFYTTKSPGQGTGLGLSTVLGIIKKHDGFITVSSQESYGTQFQIYLPVSGASLGQSARDTE